MDSITSNADILLEYFKPEHIVKNEGLKEVMEFCGEETAKLLLKHHGGMRNLYIPEVRHIMPTVTEYILHNKNKLSVREMRRVTGLSQYKIKQIIKQGEPRLF